MADFMAGGEEAEGHHEERLMVSSDNFRLAVAHEEMNSRRRNTMEDVHRIRSVLHETLPLHSYLGIYDGHGGRQIVDFLEEALENNLAKELLLPDDASIAERVTRLVKHFKYITVVCLIIGIS